MVIVLLVCTVLFSLLSAVISSQKKYGLRRIAANKSLYIFLTVNLVLGAFAFSAVYADFFALLSGITLPKALVCAAISASVVLITSLLYFHKKAENSKKYALGLLICLVISLFTEVFVYNFRAIQSFEYKERSFLEHAEVYCDHITQDGEYVTREGLPPIVIEMIGIDERIENIRFKASAHKYNGETIDIPVKIEATDKANELYITSMPKRTLYGSNDASTYIPMQLRGNTDKLKITISSAAFMRVTIEELSINSPKPFDFDCTRMLLIFAIALALYLIRPSSPLYEIKLRSSKLQLLLTSFIVLAQILFIYSIIASTGHFKELIASHQAQYQQLAESFRHGVLHLETEVPQFLLEMENPYDYALRTAQKQSYYWDAALYDGHYYVYFGAVPAALLYLPYNLITNKALPNDIAIFIFAILLIIGCFALVRQIIKRYFPNKNISYLTYILLSLLLTNTSGLLYIASYPDMYSVPIIAALAFTTCGLSLWLAALSSRRARAIKLALGSLCMALVAGCRPNMLLFSFLFFPFFFGEIIRALREKRVFKKESIINAVAFATPYVIVAAVVMWYNYARFGSPIDFGANYNLTTNDMTSRGFVWERMGVAAFSYLLQPPKITSAFPFIRFSDFDSTYMGVTIRETTYGGLFSYSPFLWIAFLIPRFKKTLSRYKLLIPAVMLIAFGVITSLLDAQLAGILQRYFSDFSLMFYLGALIVFLAVLADTENEEKRKDMHKILLVCMAVAFIYQLLLYLRNAYLGDYIKYLFWY